MMTSGEWFSVILSIISVVVVNFMILKRKDTLYRSKLIWLYYMLVKFAVLFPALFTILQLYVFNYDFVGAIGDPMYHNVMFCYIGYIVIAGVIFFMEQYQVNLFRLMSLLLFAYQCWMAKLLIGSKDVISVMGNSPMNPFANGEQVGLFLCCLGPILSFFGVLTVWHYWKGNDKSDFV